jgi:hypothetical protein
MSANSSEARKAASYVLGSSVNAPAAPDSFGDRVIRTTARVYKRGNPYTVIEEISEGDIKFMITEGIVERPWVISALRQWESQMGDALFRKSITDDSQVENQDIVEAYSKMVVSYFAGRATAGDQGRIFSKEFRSEIAKALRMDMNAVLSGYASLFEAVYRRAAMIEKARKEGTLPADLESFLSKSAGMSPQRVFEREVVKEGEGIAEEMGVEFVDEETFSTMTPAAGRVNESGFYSKMERVLDSKIQGKQATVDQVKAVINNPSNGIKPDEIKWTGVMSKIDSLASENNGKVPKAELLEFLTNEGAVRFEEVALGGVAKVRTQEELNQLEREAQRTQRWDEYEQAVLEFEDQQLGSDANQTGNQTKYSKY